MNRGKFNYTVNSDDILSNSLENLRHFVFSKSDCDSSDSDFKYDEQVGEDEPGCTLLVMNEDGGVNRTDSSKSSFSSFIIEVLVCLCPVCLFDVFF
jgi:hypothetical protein